MDQRKQNERGSGGGEADRKRGGVVKKGLKPAGQRQLVPEVRVGGLSAASPFSDVFSLCSALLTFFGNATSTRVEAVRSALLSGCVEIPGSRASLKDIETAQASVRRVIGIGTDIQTGPNGNLFVVSISNRAVYEIFRSQRSERRI